MPMSTTPLGACTFSIASGLRTHSTGKERDGESGLDYFGARYYASSMGRWMSPDWADKPEAVPYSSLGDPQSLNLYGYVGNNPLSHADADGHPCDTCAAFMNWVHAHTAQYTKATPQVAAVHGTPANAGPVTINANVAAAGASSKGAVSPLGANISGQANASVATITGTASHSNTQINDLSASANASAVVGAAGNQVGLSGQAGVHLDVLSATQTFTFGRVTLSATGEVGAGAQVGLGLTNQGFNASAGATVGGGGTLSLNINWGSFSSSASTSGNAQTQTTVTRAGRTSSTSVTTSNTVKPVNQ